MRNMKSKHLYIGIVLILLVPVILCGCFGGNSGKIEGVWLGTERVSGSESTALNAELDLKNDGTFTAKFTPPDMPREEISGTYKNTPERSLAFSPEEYGSILFQYETDGDASVKACGYRVSATTLYLENWTDSQGVVRNLMLFR